MAKITIERELLDATGLKPSKKESQQDYFKRLHDAVQELKDDDWDALSQPAQNWVNAAANAVKKDADIADFPDSAPPDDDDDDGKKPAAADDDDDDGKKAAGDDDEEDEVARKPAKGKNGKAGKPAKAEKEKPAKAAKPDKSAKAEKSAKPEKADRKTGPKSSGVKVDIKKAILKDPTATVEDIMAALKKGGTKSPSRPTVAGIRAEFRHSLAVLKSEGHLKGIEL
jgi:hypothetical protein